MNVRSRVLADRRPSQRASAVLLEQNEVEAEASRAVQTPLRKESSPTGSPVILRRAGGAFAAKVAAAETQSSRAPVYQTQQQQAAARNNDNQQSESSSRTPSARSSGVPAGAGMGASVAGLPAPPVAPKPSLSIEARQSMLFAQGPSARSGPGPTPPPVASKPDFTAAGRASASARANAGEARSDADAS